MVAIKQQLVASRSLTSGVGNPCNYITIHETANTNKGANAQSHANLQSKGNSRLASWHYQVDDKEIIQSFLDNVRCLHAGDGRGKGNMESIGIEICVNSDGNFKNAVKNAAELVKYLMKKHDIGISHVVQHSRWSGKDCPHNLRDGSKGINWNDFIGLVKGTAGVHVPSQEVGSAVITKPSSKTIDQLADEVIAGKHGSGAQRKQSLGSQYEAVQKRVNEKLLGSQPKPKPATKSIDQLVKETLAGKHGNGEARKKSLGSNYQAVMNVINGKASAPKKAASKPKGNMKTNSIVDYLKSIKVDSSFTNRKKLAAKHGIKNYSGTSSQNAQLLKKMRG